METLNRQVLLLKLTRKLVICTAVLLAIILMFFFTPAFFNGESSAAASDPGAQERSFLTLIVFGTGLIGGFVSIQQRIHRVTDGELKHLSESWSGVLLIPIYGGIFAIVLHVIFYLRYSPVSCFHVTGPTHSQSQHPPLKILKPFLLPPCQ